jgi:hypothetical protein
VKPQSLTFYPGPVDQSRGARHVPMGGLVTAENMRMPKKGELRKRQGLSRTAPSTDGGTLGNVHSGVYVAGADVLKDDKGQFYAYDTNGGILRQMGSNLKSPMPVMRGVQSASVGLRRISGIVGSTDELIITLGTAGYSWRIRSYSTGVTRSEGSVTVSGILGACAVYDTVGDAFWIFTYSATTIRSHKLDRTTFATTTTTYVTATYSHCGMKAFRLSSPGEIAVVWQEKDNTNELRGQSYLDTATGAPKASPAAVTATNTVTSTNINAGGGTNILVSTGATSWYWCGWRAAPAATGSPILELFLHQVTTATLATAASSLLATITTGMTNDAEIRGVTCGWLDTTTGNRVVLAQYSLNNTTTERPENYLTRKYVWDGATSTASDFRRGSWLASDPSQVTGDSTGEWYVMIGYEDGQAGYPTTGHGGFQRSLFLCKSDGVFVSQALTQGLAPPVWHRNEPPAHNSATAQLAVGDQFVTHLTSPETGKLYCAIGRATDIINGYRPTALTWDFTVSYGKPVTLGESAVFPGGIPCIVGTRQFLRELTPLVSPGYLTTAAGGGAAVGDIVVGVVYRYVHQDGRITRSAPITATIAGATTAAALTYPLLRHFAGDFGGVAAQAEIYCSQPGSVIPTLQKVTLAFSSGADTNSQSPFYDAAGTIITGTPLYTTGGGLLNSPAPPCRWLAFWRDRLFAGGTHEDGETWYTQELEEGGGPAFNAAALRSFWNDGSGPITGGVHAGWDALVIFRSNALAVLEGAGPDGNGQNGAYVARTLDEPRGLTAPMSLVTGKDGAYFQDAVTGRACVVTPGGKIVENMQGADDLRTSTVLCSLYSETDGQLWLGLANGVYLVQDMRWPLPGAENQPLRQWWKWVGGGTLLTPGAMLVGSSGPRVWEAGGALRTVRSSTFTDQESSGEAQFLQKVKTGKLQPFGPNGSGMLDNIVVQAHYVGAHTLRMTVTPDGGTPSVHTVTAASPGVWVIDPAGCLHVTEVEVQIEETGGTAEGFVLEGITMNVKPDSRSRLLSTSQKVAAA